jgi:2,4-diketo-3-deoxy-L-fuconate hydrolase
MNHSSENVTQTRGMTIQHDYRLATFSYRGHEYTGIEIAGCLIDLGLGYEYYKERVGQRDFFKAKHGYAMLDVLEEWDLFLDVFEKMAAFYQGILGREGSKPSFAYRPDEVKLLPPVVYPNKILNAGSNFYDHALEMGAARPVKEGHEPYFFYKGSRHTLIGHGDKIRLTPRSEHTDWEAELAVIIGRYAKNVPVEHALEYVAGYTCYNDISARDRMIRKDETFDYDWFANKGNDTFAPIGPYLVPRPFIKDPQNLSIRCYVSGELMQDTNTNQMVWSVAELIAAASSVTTLSPGDVIATGTGAGVGMAKGIKVNHGEIGKVFAHMYAGKSRLLRPGDIVKVEIEGIGSLENGVE